MILTCENCNTRFNLDENLIKESGSKVRCSKCRHIFTVYKPGTAEGLEPTLELEQIFTDLPEQAETLMPAPETGEATEEPAHVPEQAEEMVLDFEPAELEEKSAEEEISLDELSIEEEPATEETAVSDQEVLLEDEPPRDEGLALEESRPEQKTTPRETPEAEKKDDTLDEAGMTMKRPKEEWTDAISMESFEGVEQKDTEKVEEKPAPPIVAKKKPRARKPIGMPVMIVLVLVLLAGGAFAAYSLLKTFDVKIPFLESLTGVPDSASIDPGNLGIALLEQQIRSEFFENKPAGRLLVIKGDVRNDYPEARNFITVKGTLYSRDGKTIQEKTVYCGNTLSDTDLQTMDKTAIDRKSHNKFGDERANFRVPSGKVLPFVVVFSDLPQNMGEFSIEVASSDPGQE